MVKGALNKNDVVTVTIEDMGHDGEGIGKADGYALFVKDAVIGDVVEVSIMKAKKNYAYAKLKKVVTPSSFRITPRCAFHRQCGGCQLQVLSYERQLSFKQDKIRNNLIRLGGFEADVVTRVMDEMVGMDLAGTVDLTGTKGSVSTKDPVSTEDQAGAFRYRNKAQYPVGTDKEGNPICGFFAGRTHDIIANTDCCLGVVENQEILEIILSYMKANKVSAYDENTDRGLIRHILIRKGFASGELMVCLVVNCEGIKRGLGTALPNITRLVEALCAVPGMTSIAVNGNAAQTNVIMGKEVVTLWGRDTIADVLHERDPQKGFALTGRGVDFWISPLSFYQINPVQTEKLYSLVLEYAGLTGGETVWDLYCGIGTISLFLANRAGKVYGVESVPEAIRDAQINAANNGISNVEFLVGKAEEVLIEKYEQEGISADVIVVDPPRKGCDEVVLKTMLRIQPERIVYVSCDSATLARDLKVLCDGGYELRKVRGVDQFGQTVHVETVVLLERKG
ncbi:MAG: 23S rRNA (uracil(1939)-C(5))-methyltransferase RlmD [Lachnospiraceae bacterium]|nr:23S rRNA (uracil(1939)-C(5))-methyltransferase RlmD [Lachnospiraceae bacterium]